MHRSAFSLVCVLFSLSDVAQAQTKTEALSLIQRARTEAHTEGIRKDGASDAQISDSGLLKLADPGLREHRSAWTWHAGVRVQRFTPQGEATMRNDQNFDLETAGATIYPLVELGAKRLVSENETVVWSAGVGIDAGYSTQDTRVVFPTGVSPAQTRLSTGILDVSVLTAARFQALRSVEWEIGWTEGLLTYSHSAPNNAVNFTRQGRFSGPRIGVSYWPRDNWAVGLMQESRASGEIEMPSGSLSMGTRLTW